MLTEQQSPAKPNIIYPDSDGQPMADNTEQFRWIVVIKENLEMLFAAVADVFVAGDLLWYPVQGSPTIRCAPDVLIVLGRPKGRRGFYKQWEEDNIAPQVVFEVLSPGNSLVEMAEKFAFYDRYGVEEYYLYDPDEIDFCAWIRNNDRLEVVNAIEGWISPRLGIRFDFSGDELTIYRPDGDRFASFTELAEQRDRERDRADRAEAQLQQEQERRQTMEAKLREMGIDPDQL